MMYNDLEYDAINTQKYEHFKIDVDKGQAPLRIDKYLTNVMANISRNRVQQAAENGSILVNGTPAKCNYKVKPFDNISLVLDTPPLCITIEPEEIPIDIVYEDDQIIVVNKQAGLVVHPGVGNFTGTLLNAIAFHLKDDKNFNANDTNVGLVHRIDKDTSGLLLIAKTPEAKTNLGKQFFNKTTHRQYQALVWGTVKEENGTIIADLARDPKDRMCFTTFPVGENPLAKNAITHYKILERLSYVTLVECQLETGRTHQIRVHFKHIGHPLFNDERYGGDQILKGLRTAKYQQFVKNCFQLCNRQALHAKTLGFVHPTTGKEMIFNSELPSDMTEMIEKWRRYSVQVEQ